MSDETQKLPGASCKRCESCDKATCKAFQRAAENKGPEFAERWWEKKEQLRQNGAADNDGAPEPENPAPEPVPK